VLPPAGFDPGENTFIAPPADGSGVEVKVSPTSDRLQLLEPFAAVGRQRLRGPPVLLKAKGKCTTDHISMAGPWLKYRGHLENISGNLFLGAVNAFTGAVGEGKDPLDGETAASPRSPSTPRGRRAWVAVGDENYGEGSVARARRHGAPLPWRQGDPGAQLRPHPRDQPEEAGRAARSRSPTRRPGPRRARTTRSARTTAYREALAAVVAAETGEAPTWAPPAEEAPGTPDTPDTDPTVDTDQAADTDPTDGTDAKRADERDPGAGTDPDAGSSAGDAPEG
jgi:hypothetical protein